MNHKNRSRKMKKPKMEIDLFGIWVILGAGLLIGFAVGMVVQGLIT
jgi:hypothetical protein